MLPPLIAVAVVFAMLLIALRAIRVLSGYQSLLKQVQSARAGALPIAGAEPGRFIGIARSAEGDGEGTEIVNVEWQRDILGKTEQTLSADAIVLEHTYGRFKVDLRQARFLPSRVKRISTNGRRRYHQSLNDGDAVIVVGRVEKAGGGVARIVAADNGSLLVSGRPERETMMDLRIDVLEAALIAALAVGITLFAVDGILDDYPSPVLEHFVEALISRPLDSPLQSWMNASDDASVPD